jgi:membrane fusion protein (multidrug efflux system)
MCIPYKPFLKLSTTIFLFVMASCGGKKISPKTKLPQQSTIVDVIIAQQQTITNLIEANGAVIANNYVALHPEASGRITYLNVPEGKFIEAGTVIARINDADLVAQLAKSKVQLDLAQQTEERLRKLLAVNGVNQADYDSALNQVNSLKADINYYQALIDKTVIKAPFSGVVGLRQVSLGAYVSFTDVIATLQETNQLKVDFNIPEEYNNIIRKGATVDVEVDASTHIKRKATIVAIEPQVNQASRNLQVRAIFPGGKGNPGAFVKVYINAGVNSKAIMVPTNSIIPDDKNNQLIVVKNGKANFINVSTGVRQADNVEITKGIQQGDTVVVTGVLFARPKAELKIRNVKTLQQIDVAADSTN